MNARGDRYSGGAIAFHWVIAALVLFNLWLGLFADSLPRDWNVMAAHKTVGITVLALSILRLAWRLTHRPPAFPRDMPGWEKAVAKSTHSLFYLLLIALPLSGWVMSSDPGRPRPVDWFGLVEVPTLPANSAAASAAHGVHGPLGYLMAALVVLHVAAALRHHFLLRDRVLARMLPLLRRSG